jgi:hypothetical protein
VQSLGGLVPQAMARLPFAGRRRGLSFALTLIVALATALFALAAAGAPGVAHAAFVSTVAGAAGSSGSQDGPFFNTPAGVAVDASGNLYCGEGDDTIRKITPAGVVTTLAGTGGQAGSVSITLDTYSHAVPAKQEVPAALIAGLVFASKQPSLLVFVTTALSGLECLGSLAANPEDHRQASQRVSPPPAQQGVQQKPDQQGRREVDTDQRAGRVGAQRRAVEATGQY